MLMVDWLGRGGIAHCTQAWVEELRRAGKRVNLVTRYGRELAASVPGTYGAGRHGGRLLQHLALVAKSQRLVRSLAPPVLVLHGTVMPQAEIAVLHAAQRAGATVVLVAHEPAPPHAVPGSRSAFVHLVRTADIVVVHSRYVADRLRVHTGRSEFTLLPLPMQVGLIRSATDAVSVIAPSPAPLALLFGNLHRGYKGLRVLEEVAATGANGWCFALVGKGSPASLAGAVTVPRFLEAAELVATVASSAVTLFPYERASQSGAVVLSQALGSVVVASAVGGIPEQVKDGFTGRLMPPRAGVEAWREVLKELSDPKERARLSQLARISVESSHADFVAGVMALIPGSM